VVFKEAESSPPLNYEKQGDTIDLSFWRAPERLFDEPMSLSFGREPRWRRQVGLRPRENAHRQSENQPLNHESGKQRSRLAVDRQRWNTNFAKCAGQIYKSVPLSGDAARD